MGEERGDGILGVEGVGLRVRAYRLALDMSMIPLLGNSYRVVRTINSDIYVLANCCWIRARARSGGAS